jgi:formate hydrogenlyase transcriptional activator
LDASTIQRYQTLLDVAQAIAAERDMAALVHNLAHLLHRVVRFDFLGLLLRDRERNSMRQHVLETLQPTDQIPPMEAPVEDSPSGWCLLHQQALVVPDVDRETRWTVSIARLRGYGVKCCCWLPLTSAHTQIGALNFGCVEPHAYSEAELDLMQRVAALVAVAVDNALHLAKEEDYLRQLAGERDRLKALLDITSALVSNLDRNQPFACISSCLRQVIQHDYASVALYLPERGQLSFFALDFPGGSGLISSDKPVAAEGSPATLACTSRKPVVLDSENWHEFDAEIMRKLAAEGMQSGCCLPLISRDRVLGSLNLACQRDHAFSGDVALLSQVANQIAIAVENAHAYREIAELKDKLAEEKLYLEDEIRSHFNFGEIVGESPAFKAVLRQVETVAPTGAAVLILGETGTGKELVARAIHELSPQRDRTFVKLNCAAIPTGLLESELFGHEKGAFTGAIMQKVGRFELAHSGTLFLDEVGEISLELQPKLLRVLQEREFERLGGTRTIRVDVRVVAATNRDLKQMVRDWQFRDDLYYRLNVFPIEVPPLRERPEDIPPLVRFFAQQCARRMKRQLDTIPSATMDALVRYPWPGNVRELQNLIERAVILSKGPVLQVSEAELGPPAEPLAKSAQTLVEAERQHILRALQDCDWVIAGPRGAATRLGMKRSTLQFRMQKLGISRTN